MIGRARGLAVAVVILGLLVIAVVARSTPSHPFHATTAAPPSSSQTARQLPSQVSAGGSQPAASHHRDTSEGSTHWVTPLLIALLAIAVAWGGWRLSRSRWTPRHVGRRGAHVGAAVTDVGTTTAPAELSEAVDQSIESLDRGPVTDGIIACWVRVESAAASEGVAIRPSETSTEFVDRVLGSYGVRATALRRLAALYREARFSTHPMGEDSRREARQCLSQIRADLGSVRVTR